MLCVVFASTFIIRWIQSEPLQLPRSIASNFNTFVERFPLKIVTHTFTFLFMSSLIKLSNADLTGT